MLKKLLKHKKFMAISACFCLVFAICCVNATEGTDTTGASAVASQLESGLSSANIWANIGVFVGFMIIVTLIAVARNVLNKNNKAIAKGRAGKV